jgi:ADP-heptose:LPS heptosyltransferase
MKHVEIDNSQGQRIIAATAHATWESRIIVGLVEHLGDIVACEPVARYLKLNRPKAHLAWVVRSEYREIVDANPYIDETITVECLTDWIKLSAHGQYDLVVDLHVNYRICQHCQIPLVKRTGNPFVTAYEWFDHGALLEAFSLGAGLPRISAQPRVYLGPEHVRAVDALELPTDFCVIHRSSNDPNKDWTEEKWRVLSQLIQRHVGLPIVEVGAGKIGELPPPIDGALSLVNRLPILQTAEVIRRARLFVGIDSGPGHLANALNVPGVVLLGQFHYFRQYCPYTGFYASSTPLVKLVRNRVGSAAEIGAEEVAEAVRYVAAATNHVPHKRAGNRKSVTRMWPWASPQAARSDAILASGLFDLGWYVVHHPELQDSPLHPIDHYLLEGAAKGLSPSSTFDFKAYQDADEQMVRAGVNPLLHYIDNGGADGRCIPMQDRGWDGAPRDCFRDGFAVTSISALLDRPETHQRHNPNFQPDQWPRIFAFYLPQFYPIPENDWAHGAGFSEWHRLIKAKPLFRGHYQPRIPGELGFYDLRSEEVLYHQIRLAQQHGVSGFCFNFYFFSGRKLLYRPIENFLKSDIQTPFMCLWANENWTKRRDGGDHDIIVAQHHSDVDDLLVLHELVPVFSDKRYVKIRGKPVLLVYKTHLFPNIRRTVDLWREEIVKCGFPDIYLVRVDDWTPDDQHPRDIGFDATYEIPSNIIPSEVLSSDILELGLCDEFVGKIVDYAKFAHYHMSRPFPRYKRFRTVMLPWDNSPRYGPRATVHVNGQGEAYKLWLLQALLDSHRYFQPSERMVFVHSWNEWCEGTNLEPDGKHGRFFLEQTREAVEIARSAISSTGLVPTTDVASELLKLQMAKDIGAFQVMRSTQMQVHYAWQDLMVERERRTRLHAEANALRERVAKLESSIEEIYNSTSWRLTGPLRSLVTRLRDRPR